MKCDAPTEFEELVASSWIDASAVLMSACGNALPARTLQVAKAVFCFSPSIEPSPLPACAALPPAYVVPLRAVADLQLPSVVAPASGLEGPVAWHLFFCCVVIVREQIPSLLVEVLKNEG